MLQAARVAFVEMGTTETSVKVLYEKLRGLAGRGDLEALRGEARPGEQSRSSADPTKAGRELGWRPEIALDVGLERTLRIFGTLRTPF